MKASTVWAKEESGLSNSGPISSNGTAGAEASRKKVTMLKVLAAKLIREVQSLEEVHSFEIQDGIDFYEEVARFEIGLIKRALTQTQGHQSRAARLLKMKITTLNSKIKHYQIQLDPFTSGYPFVDSSELESYQNV